MKIAIGCDHIVTDIKNHIVSYLEKKGHIVKDFGTYDHVRTHYPIYGLRVGLAVSKKEVDCGIVCCGTGVGISNAAQKVKGVRCALVGDVQSARYAKEELDCNVLALGGRVFGIGLIEDMIDAYLESEYQNKNQDLIEKINNLIDCEQDESMFDEYLEKWERGEYHD